MDCGSIILEKKVWSEMSQFCSEYFWCMLFISSVIFVSLNEFNTYKCNLYLMNSTKHWSSWVWHKALKNIQLTVDWYSIKICNWLREKKKISVEGSLDYGYKNRSPWWWSQLWIVTLALTFSRTATQLIWNRSQTE